MCIRNSGCRLLLPPTVDRIEADATACTKFVLTPVGNSGKGSEQYIAGCVLAAPSRFAPLALEPPFLDADSIF